ncbi:hypothetical protein MHK_003890 [Candidatus Magnetomorum sp. HK-1]|nr:hypothetical protein MHK_003890 [Candidatus Magnetomorum sp. HK-1]
MVHSIRGKVRYPCYRDKTNHICACKNNKGQWKIVKDHANQWQIVLPDNYQCRHNESSSEVIKGVENIEPSTNKDTTP